MQWWFLLSASCWGSPPRKARWGGLKEDAGRVLCRYHYIIHSVVFKKRFLFLPWSCFLSFSLLPPSALQKAKLQGKIFPPPKILPRENRYFKGAGRYNYLDFKGKSGNIYLTIR